MDRPESLNHSKWECKYHVVWIPKYRKKTLYGQLRKYLGQVFKDLARSRERSARKAYDVRSCAYADLDTAEIFGS